METVKVCIDAGHGKETAGKCSPDGSYFEHEFNLDVAKRVRAHLLRCGVQVVMTREDEHDVSLAQRHKISNDAGCDYFLSIHTNAAGEKGWYTAEDGVAWNTAEGWIAFIIAQGGKAEQLAGKIRARAIPLLGCKDRGVEVKNLHVLRTTDCPAVIVEHGFHTHRGEVEKLKSDAYRSKCAESDAQGLCDQMGIAWVPELPTAPWYEDARKYVMEHGISDGTRPDEPATRAEVWTMLQRAAKV